ncbi:MAG: hypothetical protein ACKOUM_11250 [Sphingopyxis sp.]
MPSISIDLIPQLADASAAFGALASTTQLAGTSVFDIVIAVIMTDL